MVTIPKIIQHKFRSFGDIKCWGFCNETKVPVQAKHPERFAEWKLNPDLGIITLPELIQLAPMHVGFGIFTSKSYSLGCLDFDHFLKNGEPDYNNTLDIFLQKYPTFAEISSSGNGVHAFYYYEHDNEDIKENTLDIEKFNINLPESDKKTLKDNKKLPGGKFYCDKHFIKLTGNVYKDNDYELKTICKSDYLKFEKTIFNHQDFPIRTKKQHSFQASFTKSWSNILTQAGIDHIEAREYIGKIAPRSKKEVVECLKIPCPNRYNHQTDRPGDISANLAILSRYSDDTSSCTCNHHSCDPASHPNLLQKLWNEIKKPTIDEGNKILKKFGVN